MKKQTNKQKAPGNTGTQDEAQILGYFNYF